MKKLYPLSVLALGFALAARSKPADQPVSEPAAQTPAEPTKTKTDATDEGLRYSNLTSEADRARLRADLLAAGLSKARVDGFLADVVDYNQTVQGSGLVDGFQLSRGRLPQYDDVALGEKWLNKYQDRHGHNCRLTTFRLMDDFIQIDNPIIENDTMLFAEKETMDREQVIAFERQQDFLSLFSYIPAKDSADLAQHIETFQQNWQKKGVHLTNDKISLISVVFYNNFEGLPTTAELFVGHIGLLWQQGDKFLFLEKLSFTEPYQWLEFSSKQAVSDYLMTRYDVDETGAVPPFVMENNELIEGYRANPNKPQAADR